MKTVSVGVNYNSHSFAQRAIAYGDSAFLYASEGDCYDRAFTISQGVTSGSGKNQDIFHFWVANGTLDKWDMSTLNDNFAHMGGIASTGKNSAALVATSAKSLNSKAKSQNEQLFIQIFDPESNMDSAANYATSGTRTGYSGPNGDEKVTDYGVKWLTNYNSKTTISNPQVVAADGKYVVLFERTTNYTYAGVYYIVIDAKGNILQKATRFSKTATLNPSRMPVYSNGSIYWSGNKYKTSKIYTYQLNYTK
jgi:hypothetical protein